MPDVKFNRVYTDVSGHLYEEIEGQFTKIGGAPTYDGHKPLHSAHADTSHHLCYSVQGQWIRQSNGARITLPPVPYAVHIDSAGQLYTYHAGAYTKVTLV